MGKITLTLPKLELTPSPLAIQRRIEYRIYSWLIRQIRYSGAWCVLRKSTPAGDTWTLVDMRRNLEYDTVYTFRLYKDFWQIL